MLHAQINIRCVLLLLDSGSDIHALNQMGVTPLAACSQRGREQTHALCAHAVHRVAQGLPARESPETDEQLEAREAELKAAEKRLRDDSDREDRAKNERANQAAGESDRTCGLQ